MAFTNTSVICLPGILGCIEHVVQLSAAFREYNTPDEGFFFVQLSLWKTSHDLAVGLAGKASDKTHDNLQRLAEWFDKGDRYSLCTSGYLKLNSRETEASGMAVPLQSKTHSTKQLYESMALNSADMSTRRCVHPHSPRQSLAANTRATTYHSSYTVVYVLGETLS
jgi:hypothetical protein